ncbi:MAG: DUF3526 domain-containing protein [Acidobacteriota bacterium]
MTGGGGVVGGGVVAGGAVWTIVRHEWRLMRREPVVGWATGLVLAAAVYALVGGAAWHDARLAEVAASHEEGATLLAEQQAAAAEGGEFSGLVGGAKTFIGLPPGPLAALSVGLADLYPERAEISIFKRPDTLFGRYQLASPLSLLVGRFDLGFVVIYLLPLFVLALAYDMLASERDGGTLALVVMQRVSLPRLLAAKVLARWAWLTLLLLILGAAAFFVGATGEAGLRVVGWFAVAWLYASFWLALAAWVATLARRPETCAAVLASAWLAAVLVLPGLVDVVAQAASPTPSRLEFVSTVRAAKNEATKASAELLATYYHEHPELSANGTQGGFIPAFYASEREVERRITPLLTDYDRRLAEQQRLVDIGRFLSPAVLANEALVDLAGSGSERHREVRARAREFLAAWHAMLAPKIFLGESLRPDDYDQLPRFHFIEPPVARQRLAGSFLGLALLTGLAFVLAHRRLLRTSIAD